MTKESFQFKQKQRAHKAAYELGNTLGGSYQSRLIAGYVTNTKRGLEVSKLSIGGELIIDAKFKPGVLVK